MKRIQKENDEKYYGKKEEPEQNDNNDKNP